MIRRTAPRLAWPLIDQLLPLLYDLLAGMMVEKAALEPRADKIFADFGRFVSGIDGSAAKQREKAEKARKAKAAIMARCEILIRKSSKVQTDELKRLVASYQAALEEQQSERGGFVAGSATSSQEAASASPNGTSDDSFLKSAPPLFTQPSSCALPALPKHSATDATSSAAPISATDATSSAAPISATDATSSTHSHSNRSSSSSTGSSSSSSSASTGKSGSGSKSGNKHTHGTHRYSAKVPNKWYSSYGKQKITQWLSSIFYIGCGLIANQITIRYSGVQKSPAELLDAAQRAQLAQHDTLCQLEKAQIEQNDRHTLLMMEVTVLKEAVRKLEDEQIIRLHRGRSLNGSLLGFIGLGGTNSHKG